MNQKARHTKLYEYLERTNALSGTDEDIRAAIRRYRAEYQAEWRRQKRQHNQEITVTLNPDELRIIEANAGRSKRTRASFLKSAALAYCNRAFIVPDISAVNSMLECLIITGAEIHKYFEDGRLPFDAGKEILKKIDALERKIWTGLHKPERLEDRILEEIRRNPAYKETILLLLTNNGK